MRRPIGVSIGMDQPNPIAVAWRILRSLLSTASPSPTGKSDVDHSGFAPVLSALAQGGLAEAARHSDELDRYVKVLESHEPDDLSRDGALAYWLNLYNAGAVQAASRAWLGGEDSVLRLPGAFHRRVITVNGENLSLDDIEHGKIRRFGDPRIHGALVCGSLSCPTLRAEPYTGAELNSQLNEQMRAFLAAGGAVADGAGVSLSRVFLWFGSDFARPHRMPTFVPATKRAVLDSVREWLPDDLKDATSVGFQSYDWGLACSVG